MTDDKKPLETRDLESPRESGEGAEGNVTPPGEMLKQARVAAKLSEQDVARELRMTVTKVRFLEADDYENLHSDTFVRGYLRTYAKLLGLDQTIVLSAYADTRRAAGWDGSPEENPIQVNLPAPSRPLWRFAILIIVLLVGLWALSVWFLGNRQDSSTDSALADPMVEMASQQAALTAQLNSGQSNPTPSNEPQSLDLQDFEPQSLEPQNLEPQNLESQESELQTSEPIERGAAADQPEASGRGAVESGSTTETSSVGPEVEALASTDTRAQPGLTDPEVLDQLRMEFEDECWVEVVDSRGDVLQADLLRPGRVLNLSGEAPFDVKMGNASAVSIELNGEPFAFNVPDNRRTLTVSVN